ncbi:MAG: sulfotransferase [Rubrobacteraceae bacterium]
MDKPSGKPGGSRRPFQDTRRSYINEQYPAYVQNNRLRAGDTRQLRREASGFEYKPLISVVVPVYDPEQAWLERALDSVLGQVYPDWELCLCDDASTGGNVRETLSRYERLDGRIKVEYADRNAGISGASNAALSMAAGEFVALLDHDDELAPDALFQVARLLQEHPEADLIYSDEDKIDQAGDRYNPYFKPDWSPDLLMSCNYVSHLGVYRRELLGEIGGFREGFEGAQDYDLVLRFTEQTGRIFHIPKVLYHWRAAGGSTAASAAGKTYTHERGRRALSEALERRAIKGSVEDGFAPNRYRVKPEIEGNPKVSIIIPTRDNLSLLKNCVKSIERHTTYHNYEILIVDNDSSDPETVEYLASVPHRVIRFRKAFSHSGINNFAATHAGGEYILLLNDDTEVISGEWLEAMLQCAQRSDVGAVGAKLLYPEGRIQHAGVLTGAGGMWNPGVASHSHQHFPMSFPGYMGEAKMIRNYSAVTAACVMLPRAVFEEVGGFDEENMPIAFNDVDLCMRIRDGGYLIIYTPYAELYHYESASRGYEGNLPTARSIRYVRERWGDKLDADPYYNPNFSRGNGDFNLRADMLRPRILVTPPESSRNDSGDSYKHPLLDGQEEFRRHVAERQENARNLDRTTLATSPAGKSTGKTSSPARSRRETSSPRPGVRPRAAENGSPSMRMEQFIWIFGAPRTGSTWLSRMMTEFENQRMWEEPLVGMLFGSLASGALRNNKQVPASGNFIMGEPHREVWLDSIRNFILDGAGARYPALKDNQYLVVKEPNGSAGAPQVMGAMPASRLVFLIRDSRDAVASRLEANKKGNWGERRGVGINWEYDTSEKLNMYTRQAAEQYSELMSFVQEAYDRHPGGKVLIKYEDLRRDAFGALAAMYEALGIEVDEARLADSVEKHSWERIPDSAKGSGQFYRKALPGGWEEDLSREQIRIIEDATRPFLSEHYYISGSGQSDTEPRTLEARPSDPGRRGPDGSGKSASAPSEKRRGQSESRTPEGAALKPFFVLGHGRSGTTWLQRTLDSHPEVICKGEGMFFGRPIKLHKGAQNLYAALAGSEELKAWHDRRVWTSGDFEDSLPGLVRDITSSILSGELSKKPEAKTVGDKTPHYVYVLGEIRSIYPEAGIIHVIRDGRDVVLSNLFNIWNNATDRGGPVQAAPEALDKRDRFSADREAFLAKGESIFPEPVLVRLVRGWNRTVGKGLEDGPKLFGEQCVQTRYESLLESPHTELPRLLDFLEVDNDRRIVGRMVEENSFEKMSGGRQRGAEDWSSFLRKGIAGDWKNYFTDRDKQVFKREAGGLLVRLGYEKDNDW